MGQPVVVVSYSGPDVRFAGSAVNIALPAKHYSIVKGLVLLRLPGYQGSLKTQANTYRGRGHASKFRNQSAVGGLNCGETGNGLLVNRQLG